MIIKNLTGSFINLTGLITNDINPISSPSTGSYDETGISAGSTINLLTFNTPGRIFESYDLGRHIATGDIVIFCDGVQLDTTQSFEHFQTFGFQCAFDDATFSTKQIKAGEVIPASFSGTPKKYTVVFATPFPDAFYFPSVTGQGDGRIFDVESKSTLGFTINTNSSTALINSVIWAAIKY